MDSKHGNDAQDPRGDNPTEAFLSTLGDKPKSDEGHPKIPLLKHLGKKGVDKETGPSDTGSDASATAGAAAPLDAAPLEGSDAEAYAALKRRRAERRKKKLIRRGIAVGVVAGVALVIAGVVLLLQPKPEQSMGGPITETAMRGTFTDQVDGKGTLEPLSLTVVSPTIDGTVASLNVTEGQTVAQGDTLLTIKNDELDAAVNEAARSLKQAKSQLAIAQSQLKQAKTALATATPAVTDDAGNIVTPAGTQGTQAEVDSAEDSVLTAQNGVESAQSTYDQAVAKANQRTVTAPAAGSIVSLNAKVGANVAEAASGAASGGSSGAGLMQIADLSKMKVTVQVGEEDIAKVAVDQTASITFPAFSDLVLTGRVTGIASVASTDGANMSYSYDGSVSPTFDVDVLIDAPDVRLKPGMTAQVTLTTQQIDDIIMVPTTALLTDDGQNYYVNVQTDAETGETERRDVTVVAKNDNFAVVGRPDDSADKPEDGSGDEDGEAPEGTGDTPADAPAPNDQSAPDTNAPAGDPNTPSEPPANADLPVSPVKDGDILVVSGGMGMDGSMGGSSAEAVM